MKRLIKNRMKNLLRLLGYAPKDARMCLLKILHFFGYYPKFMGISRTGIKIGFFEGGGGFFSCCTSRFRAIIYYYFNVYKKLPDHIDSSELFRYFKYKEDLNVEKEYFKTSTDVAINYTKPVKITTHKYEDQYSDYKLLNFRDINPFVEKYFTPSDKVMNIIDKMEKKYNLDYRNLCALFYRGNDKAKETNAPTYDEFLKKATEIKKKYPHLKFLIQSDEKDFLERMENEFPDSIIFKDEIIAIENSCKNVIDFSSDKDKRKNNFEYLLKFLAITVIISKCEHIICTSGNCSFWVVLYRGNADNVYQYSSPKQYVYGLKNYDFDKNRTNFWF